MFSQVFKRTWMIALMAIATFTACNKEDTISSTDDVENYVDGVLFDMQEQGNCGKFGCYEFVFPITISFPDGSSTEVSDYDSLREALKTYREANPDGERPTLGFPLEVMTEDGDMITVNSKEELHELRVQCRREFFKNHRPKGHRFRGMFCFKLDYPVSIELPDGTTVEAQDRLDLQYTLRRWRKDNPESEERPSLVFPLSVTMEDGTQVTVDSKEALKDIKDSCSR